jgi:hypothetical protein
MRKPFVTWKEAHHAAIDLANECSMDSGIEKSREFGKEVFIVKLLPRPENCQGGECFMERVKPGTPKSN